MSTPKRNEMSFCPPRERALRLARSLLALTVLTAAISCGDDDSSKSDNGGSGGSGGRAGTGGQGGGSSTPQPVPCGSTKCTVNNPLGMFSDIAKQLGFMLPMPVACCLDESTSKCGTAPVMGGTCEPPPVADSRCPGLQLQGIPGGGAGMQMAGCCINNMCGLDGSFLGRGCVENASAKAMLNAFGIGMFANVPPARACDAPPPTMMMDEDAGPGDAGKENHDAGNPNHDAGNQSGEDAGI